MKKKIFFIISAILQILASIYIILNANTIIEFQLASIPETFSMFPEDFQEKVTEMLTNNFIWVIIFESMIAIVLNAITINIASKNSILKNKGKLIIFSIVCMLTSYSSVVGLLSIINIIVLAFSKRKKEEDYPSKEKNEIPIIEYKKSNKKEILFGIILIVAYFSQIFIPDNFLDQNYHIARIIIYIFLFVLSIFIFKDKLKTDIKLFKDNSKAYFKYIFSKLVILYIIYIFASLICVIITQEATSINQSLITSMPIWFIIPTAIIWAPVVEELVFRGTLRRFISNNKLFIVISAIIFGLLHSIVEPSLFNVFVMGIPYAILGGFLAYMYSKTNNIITNIFIHAFHNTIGVIFSILLFIV